MRVKEVAYYDRKQKNSKGAQNFAGIPRKVMRHPDYHMLSGNAAKLLFDLAFQYRGSNNGDLTTAFHVLKKRGWKSRQTIDRAKRQLLDNDFIIETRLGRFTNPGGRCALYALTWESIDECQGKGLEVKATAIPKRLFTQNEKPAKPLVVS
jgi:hypothetical protein